VQVKKTTRRDPDHVFILGTPVLMVANKENRPRFCTITVLKGNMCLLQLFFKQLPVHIPNLISDTFSKTLWYILLQKVSSRRSPICVADDRKLAGCLLYPQPRLQPHTRDVPTLICRNKPTRNPIRMLLSVPHLTKEINKYLLRFTHRIHYLRYKLTNNLLGMHTPYPHLTK
jgi:hypothetical protein